MICIGSILKSRQCFANKCLSSQGYGFSIIHVWMWELNYKERQAPKNWTVVLETTLESPLDCKEIQPVHPKGDQFWIFIGRTDAEAEIPILWPPDVKNWLIWKDPGVGKDWRQKEKGTTEDEMVGWHHRLNRHEFEQASGFGDVQRSLACCSLWGHRQLELTDQLNQTKLWVIFDSIFDSIIWNSTQGSHFSGDGVSQLILFCPLITTKNSKYLKKPPEDSEK